MNVQNVVAITLHLRINKYVFFLNCFAVDDVVVGYKCVQDAVRAFTDADSNN